MIWITLAAVFIAISSWLSTGKIAHHHWKRGIKYGTDHYEVLVGPAGIRHFDETHFTGVTIGGRKFVYCPYGKICSWSEGDYDNKYCHYEGKFFEELK